MGKVESADVMSPGRQASGMGWIWCTPWRRDSHCPQRDVGKDGDISLNLQSNLKLVDSTVVNQGRQQFEKVSYRWWVLSTAVLLLDLSPQRHGFVLCFKAVHCFECAKLHVLLKGEGLISRVGIEHLFFLSLRSNLCGETWVNSKSLVPMESLHHSLWGCCFEVCC